jgi:hypothetical protein
MKTILLLSLISILCVSARAALETNTENVVSDIPDSTAADIAKVFSDFGIHVSLGGITIALAILIPFTKAAAGYLRKLIPKTAQVNGVGIALAHVAGIDNPTLESLAAEIPKPKV